MLNNTAILLFSRLPEEEVLHKRISGKTEVNLALWQHIYAKTLAAAKQTNLPLIGYTEKKQQGINFGERITNAIADVFKQGFENIIVVGGDCASITKKQIFSAHQSLINGKGIVAGQDRRAGVYLFGLNKNCFNPEKFLQFSWQTNKLFNELFEYGSIFSFGKLFDVLNDINTKQDILKCIQLFNFNSCSKKLFNRLISSFILYGNIVSENIQSFLFAFCNILRGPPCTSR